MKSMRAGDYGLFRINKLANLPLLSVRRNRDCKGGVEPGLFSECEETSTPQKTKPTTNDLPPRRPFHAKIRFLFVGVSFGDLLPLARSTHALTRLWNPPTCSSSSPFLLPLRRRCSVHLLPPLSSFFLHMTSRRRRRRCDRRGPGVEKAPARMERGEAEYVPVHIGRAHV